MNDDGLTTEQTMRYIAQYTKKLSDDLRELRIKSIMQRDEIGRLRGLLGAANRMNGVTGFLIERDDERGSVIICGPDDEEITMCALLYQAAKELLAEKDKDQP